MLFEFSYTFASTDEGHNNNVFSLMALLSILILALTIALSLVLASSPLFLGLWVLFLALRLSLFLGLITASWLGLFMFLIYVGGLLVIFAYFVALAPNQLIEGKRMLFLTFLTYLRLILIIAPNFILFNTDFLFQPQNLLTSLFSFSNILIYILLALILFFALVSVVKIRAIASGPLRPFS